VKSHDVVKHYDELCEDIGKIYEIGEFEKGFERKEGPAEWQTIGIYSFSSPPAPRNPDWATTTVEPSTLTNR